MFEKVTYIHNIHERQGTAASGSWRPRDIDWKFCFRAQHYGTPFFALFIILALAVIHWTAKPRSRPFCKQPAALWHQCLYVCDCTKQYNASFLLAHPSSDAPCHHLHYSELTQLELVHCCAQPCVLVAFCAGA